MNILTHFFISKKIYNELDKYYSVKLSLSNLLWGSIKPDLTNTDISHCKDETFYLFYQKLDDLRKMDFNKNRDQYSLQLGEIFHYLCDYFCYAHNEKELLKYYSHICYENNLHKTAKKIENKLHYNGYIDYSHLSFLELIEQKYNVYLKTVPSYENDVLSSYQIMMDVVTKLFIESGICTFSQDIVQKQLSAYCYIICDSFFYWLGNRLARPYHPN